MPVFERLRQHLADARAQARLVARLLIAALLSYVIAVQWFDLPQGYWATISALVVVQASVGATLGAGIDRVIGTLAGAAVGALAALGRYADLSELALLALALTPLSIFAALRPAYRIAPVTAVIVLLSGTDLQAPWLPAFHRVAEIGLGTAVGIAVSLVVWPSHARVLVRAALARALAPQTELLHWYLVRIGCAPQATLNSLNDRFRNEIAQAEKALAEAQREPDHRVDALHSQIRAVRRLHSDILFVGRVTQNWRLDAIPAELQQKLGALEAALHQVLDAVAQTVGTPEPGDGKPANLSLGAVDRAMGQLVHALENGTAASIGEAALLPTLGQILRRDLAGLIDTVSRPPSSAS